MWPIENEMRNMVFEGIGAMNNLKSPLYSIEEPHVSHLIFWIQYDVFTIGPSHIPLQWGLTGD
jgi:hypothetical protein